MRKLKSTIAFLALIAAGNAAAVSNGDVTFNGEVIDSTCSIVAGDESLTVTLPTVNRTALNADGAETGSTAFDIRVENCPVATGSPTKVAVHFEANGSTGVDPVTGNLVNVAATTPAQNVQVRLYDYGVTDGAIKVGSTGKYFDIKADGSATTTYAGGYYATAAATVGLVNAKVLYTLAYQ